MKEREYKVALSLADGVGPVAFRDILEQLASQPMTVEELFREDAGLLSTHLNVSIRIAEGIKTVQAKIDGVRETLDLLMERDITLIILGDEEYPPRLEENLNKNAPPVLYCYGRTDLLREPSGAVVGTRSPDEETVDLAQGAARVLAQAGRTVVSGCARGVDSAAHLEALDAGGNTLGVLSHGILATRTLEAFREGADPSSFLLLSQFPPKQSWNAGAATTRNKTICALADTVIVIQAGARGGTRQAGNTALKMGKPVFAVAPPCPAEAGWEGNVALFKAGAVVLERDRETGQVDFSPALAPAKRPPAPDESGQPRLF